MTGPQPPAPTRRPQPSCTSTGRSARPRTRRPSAAAGIGSCPRCGTYRLDTRRSTIRFRIRGMFGLAEVTGTFAVRDGTVTVADPAEASEVVATVDATSVDTANARRDKDLRSKRFLRVSEYPIMVF